MISVRHLFIVLTICFAKIHLSCSGFQQASIETENASDRSPSVPVDFATSVKGSLIPYQRVFLPKERLAEIGDELSNFTTYELSDLTSLMGKYQVDQEIVSKFASPPELESLYMAARLDGRNLVSSLSRIRISRGSVLSESIRLSPWTLAIQPGRQTELSRTTNQEPLNPEAYRWGHEPAGNPLINLHCESVEEAIQPLDVPFQWSLRSLPSSKPTSLQFTLSIPRFRDGCLLLSLPPQASIQDSDVASFRIVDWPNESKRFGDWASLAELEFNRLNRLKPANNSLWVIELSGMNRARFTIAFDSSSGANSDGRGSMDHLVLEQTIEHEISSKNIVSITKIELSNEKTAFERNLRFKLPNPSRLRKLTVDGRDVAWKFQDGFIVCSSEELRRVPIAKEASIPVRLEFVTSRTEASAAPTSEQEIVLTKPPLMALENSFVFRGVSIIKLSRDVEMTKLIADAKLRSLDRDEELAFEWWGYAPEIQMSLEERNSEKNFRLLTKVQELNDGLQLAARLFLPPSCEPFLVIEWPKGWMLTTDSLETTSRSSSYTFLSEETSDRIQTTFQLSSALVPRYLDFKLRPIESHGQSELSLDSQWIRINGESVPHLLSLENLTRNWRLRGVEFQDILAPSTLTTDQKSVLDSPDKATLIRLGDQPISLFKVLGRQPPYRIETELRRAGQDRIRVSHRLVFDELLLRESLLVEHVPLSSDSAIWNTRDQKGTIIRSFGLEQVKMTEDQSLIPLGGPVQIIEWIGDIVAVNHRIQVPIPRVLPSYPTQVRVIADDTIDIDAGANAAWLFLDDGNLAASLPIETNMFAASFRIYEPESSETPIEPAIAIADLFIDGQGHARADWTVQVSIPGGKKLIFAFDSDWLIDKSSLTSDQSNISVRVEANEDKSQLIVESSKYSRPGKVKLYFRTTKRLPYSVPHAWKGWSVDPPQLFSSDGKCLDSSGTLWFPRTLDWIVAGHEQEFAPLSKSWPRPNWWIAPKKWFLSDSKPHDDLFASDKPRRPNESLCGKEWQPVASWTAEQHAPILLKNHRLTYQVSMLYLFCGAAAGFLMMRWSKWLCAMVFFALVSGFLVKAIDETWLPGMSALATGATFGIICFLLRSVVSSINTKASAKLTQSAVWDVRTGDSLGKAAVLFFAAMSGLIPTRECLGQSQAVTFDSPVSRILMPYENDSRRIEQALVPNAMLKRLKGESVAPYMIKSAKHKLILDLRGKTVDGVDQITSVYEFLVQSPNVTVEIPFRPSQQTLTRFVVDRNQESVSPPISGTKEFLSWTFEREGTRTIQVVYSPRLMNRPAPLEPTLGITTREIEVAVLPCANAYLEVESDSSIQFDLESQGGVFDPVLGRYEAHMGSLPVIKGRIQYLAGLSTTSATNPRNQAGLALEIEMLLQSKSVVARTRLVNKSTSGPAIERPFTMEVDKMWEPIGTSWGNLKLVESKGDRLQYRKRYVFESIPSGIDSRAESEYSIYWSLREKDISEVPLLFAECIDPVIRPSTFRFGRFSRSEWNVEQVNTWTPAINEPELLNWPELKAIKADQRAISLRVPTSGGGYLRRSLPLKTLKAGIASRWVLQDDAQVLASRIILAGTSSSDVLEIEIPRGFRVDEATNNSRPVRVLEREEGGVRIAQLVTERSNLENFDFSVRAIRNDIATDDSMTIPWIGVRNAQVAEQNVQLAASNKWTIEILSATMKERRFVGQGENVNLVSLMQGDQIRASLRTYSAKGALSISTKPLAFHSKHELSIIGTFDVAQNGAASLWLEFPAEFADLWKSEGALILSCPIVGRAWLQVPIVNPQDDGPFSRAEISFQLTREQLEAVHNEPESIRILNTTEVQTQPSLDQLIMQIEIPPVQESQRSEEFTYHRLVATKSNGDQAHEESRYWIRTDKVPPQIRLKPNTTLVQIRVNGDRVKETLNDDFITFEFPRWPSRTWVELSIETNSCHADDRVACAELIGSLGTIKTLDDDHPIEALRVAYGILQELDATFSGSIVSNSPADRLFGFWTAQVDRLIHQITRDGTSEDRRLVDDAIAFVTSIQERLDRKPLLYESNGQKEPAASSKKPSAPPIFEYAMAVIPSFAMILVILVSDGRHRPALTLFLVAGLIWYLTGWWVVALMLIVFAIIDGLDTIWLQRSSRFLVRSK